MRLDIFTAVEMKTLYISIRKTEVTTYEATRCHNSNNLSWSNIN